MNTNYQQFALNEYNTICFAPNTEKGQKLYCLNCGTEMILAKGKIKIHHFKHKNVSCDYETYIHKLGKKILFDKLEKTKVNENILLNLEYKLMIRKMFLDSDYPIILNKNVSTFFLNNLNKNLVEHKNFLFEYLRCVLESRKRKNKFRYSYYRN